jgi:type I restriction enzyme S subunit
VTRGLDKTVPMKDSGIEWLGEVPKHWKIKHLKNLAEIKGGKDSKAVELEEGGYPIYGSGVSLVEHLNTYTKSRLCCLVEERYGR